MSTTAAAPLTRNQLAGRLSALRSVAGSVPMPSAAAVAAGSRHRFVRNTTGVTLVRAAADDAPASAGREDGR